MFVANRDDKMQRHRPLLRQDGGTWKSRAAGENGRAAKAVVDPVRSINEEAQ